MFYLSYEMLQYSNIILINIGHIVALRILPWHSDFTESILLFILLACRMS